MKKVPVYILAGGKSSRFGADKARHEIDGVPLIRRVAESLRPVASEVTVVANRAGEYQDLGMRTIADIEQGLGPLGGVLTALEHRKRGWLLCATCDRIGLKADWLEELVLAARDELQAVAFKEDMWQPFPAMYHCSMLELFRRALAEGGRSTWRLIECAASHALPLPADWGDSVDINRPEQATQIGGN